MTVPPRSRHITRTVAVLLLCGAFLLPAAAASETAETADPQITVTLVRWPYT